MNETWRKSHYIGTPTSKLDLQEKTSIAIEFVLLILCFQY